LAKTRAVRDFEPEFLFNLENSKNYTPISRARRVVKGTFPKRLLVDSQLWQRLGLPPFQAPRHLPLAKTPSAWN